MKLFIGIILILVAVASFIFGVAECYGIFWLKEEASGLKFAISVVTVFPIPQILFFLGIVSFMSSYRDKAMSSFKKKRRIL